MNSVVSSLLVGQRLDRSKYHLLLAVGLFVVAFQGYRTEFFTVSGGLFLPGDAFFLGPIAAGWVGLRGGGFLFAWVIAYGSILGAHTARGLFSYSGRTLAERIEQILHIEMLLGWGVVAILFAAVPFVLGRAVRYAYRSDLHEQFIN